MKSTSLKNRALQLAAMFMVLIAGLSFMSCSKPKCRHMAVAS